MNTFENRLFCSIGGLFGAAGVAAYAASSHLGGYYTSIAPILLCHGIILVATSLSKTTGLLIRLGGVLITLGVLLFSSDMIVREMGYDRLFAYAAPLGGTVIILGWLMFAIFGLLPREQSNLED